MPIFPSFFVNKDAAAYEIEQSLRFERTDSAHLRRTFGTPTTQNIYTYSTWLKYIGYGQDTFTRSNYKDTWLLSPYQDNNDWGALQVNNSLKFVNYTSDNESRGTDGGIVSDMVVRDPSAWYHVVFVLDATQSALSDRMEIYVNGVKQSVSSTGNPVGQNQTTILNKANTVHDIGRNERIGQLDANARYLSMMLAETHFVDGQALDATDFGEFDDNGVWRPIEYTGTYGNNGFYLKFDETATNGIGHDHSGNGNNWTASGFTTSGTGTDVMSDTPTTNWCTLNPLSFGPSNADMYEGNLRFDQPTSTRGNAKGTIAVSSGKWYWEVTPQTTATANVAGGILGAAETDIANQPGNYATGYSYYSTGETRHNNVDATYGDSYGAGDVIGTALDLDAGTLVFYKNGASQGTAYSSVSGTFVPAIGDTSTGSNSQLVCNFGQREFAYPPGTASATDYFNTVVYSGDNTNQAITGVGFQSDLVWIKSRSSISDHVLQDSVRGVEKFLISNNAASEDTDSGTITSFDSDGFTIGSGNSKVAANNSGETFVAWCWKAGGTASSNTDGDIDSSVSASTDAGFSVFTYTGNGGTDQTVGHGLGAAPSFCIVKSRASNSWFIRHDSLPSNENLNFNSSGTVTAGGGGLIGDLSSTSTITLKSGSNNADNINANGTNYVAYCWVEKSGVSKFGSFTGNGSSTGPFIECGFKPRMVIVKRTDANSNWFMYDTIRGTNNKLYADANATENGEDGGSTTSNTILSLSTGFQMTSGNGSNASGGTYIFMAWAENFSADADFKSLNTANLPAPDIADGSDYFDTFTWTGDSSGATRTLSGLAFQPDLVWAKGINQAISHQLTDAVRGAGATSLRSDDTRVEGADGTSSGYLSAFTSDGFTTTSSSTNVYYNTNTYTYVAWNWLAANGTSSNTNGSITSTVSANPTAGFSIISYSGNSTNGATIGHGLGVAPAMFIVKARTNNVSSVKDWPVFHHKMTSTPQNTKMQLNKTDTESPVSTYWNNTAPTSTVITLGTNGRVNVTNEDYICYAFAEVEGYSKFGYYAASGQTFVHTGFAPAFVMIKALESANWVIFDRKRSPYNKADEQLSPNSAAAEVTNDGDLDFLSNGFKLLSGAATTNAYTYVYAAFAENPFGGDGVSPATAR